MIRRVVAVMTAIGLALVVPASTTRPIEHNAHRSVAIATLPCSSALQSTSSGFVIDDELIVTVAHAIFETRDFAVRDARGTWHDGLVRYMDLERDLAIVYVEGLRATQARLGSATSESQVQMVEGAASGTTHGHIRRSVNIRTEVVGDRSEESLRRGYELALEISAGDSGSGVVARNGELVAIVFAKSKRRPATTWATSSAEVEAILDSRGVPDWECSPGSDRELELSPVQPDGRAEDRLALGPTASWF